MLYIPRRAVKRLEIAGWDFSSPPARCSSVRPVIIDIVEGLGHANPPDLDRRVTGSL
jgi:hypothetical protein